MSKKVAFVTPRYGPQIMGGAETAVRQLAEHLRAQTDWEAEVHTTCALDAITWADELEPGTTELNGVTVHRHPSAQGRLPDFYGLDGPLRLAPRLTTREQGEALGRVQRARLAPAGRRRVARRTPTSSPSRRTSTTRRWPPSAGSPCRPCSTRPRTTSRRSTSRSSAAPSATPTRSASTRASERSLVERMYPVAERPQIVLGLGVGESEGAGRPGAELLGLGDRPYLVSVGRVDEHKGSKMLASYFATYKERHPGRWPWRWSARSRTSSSRTPTSS